jgi:hypothetical protein
MKKQLTLQEWEAISPYDDNDPKEEEEALAVHYGDMYWKLLAEDILKLSKVSGIVFLSGWENSKGARLEAYVGLLRGIPMWEYMELGEVQEVQLDELSPAYVAGVCAAQFAPREALIKLGLIRAA